MLSSIKEEQQTLAEEKMLFFSVMTMMTELAQLSLAASLEERQESCCHRNQGTNQSCE